MGGELIDFLDSLWVEVLQRLALISIAMRVWNIVSLLCSRISNFSICTHYLILQSEIIIVTTFAVSIEFDDMRWSHFHDKFLEWATYILNIYRFFINSQLPIFQKMQRKHLITIHITLLHLLLRKIRRHLTLHSLIRIHRSGDKEEDEEHERNISRRCGVQAWYAMLLSTKNHFSRLF